MTLILAGFIFLILVKPFETCPTKIVKGSVTATGKLLLENGSEYGKEFFSPVNTTHFTLACLAKCCPFGNAYKSQKCVKNDSTIHLQIYDEHLNNFSAVAQESFHLEQVTCQHYDLNPEYEEEKYYLLLNGQLYLPNADKNNLTYNFCVENVISESEITSAVFACFPDAPADHFYPYGLFISTPFLIATLLVYALIPDLQNLNGKNLMSQLSAMIIGYTFLGSMQVMTDNRASVCSVGTYVVQFSFLATFFWLNVTSYDLWYTFSGPGRLRGGQRRNNCKFYMYSAYAWGSSFIITLITLIMNSVENLPDSILKPDIRSERCWFTNDSAQWAYFYAPIVVLLGANIIFFAITAWTLFIVHKQADPILRGKSRTSLNQKRFLIYFKLFIIMGVNWIMEVISGSTHQKKHIFFIADIFNSLQGLFIFVIFVLKKRTFEKLKEKFGFGKYHEQHTATSLMSARSTNNNSMAIHGMESEQEL